MSSGNAPTDTLISCMEEGIIRMEEEKAHVEEEIARMEKEKTRMEKEKIRMEKEMRRTTALLSSLRAKKRNSLLPIFRLSPEILAIIFICGACDYYRNPPTHRCIQRIPRWVDVSYVCSYWRSIALNCPTLWTYHLYQSKVSLRWTEESLFRSKQASLKISCLYTHTLHIKEHIWWLSFVDNLLKHSGRTQDLCLHLPPALLPAKFSLCAPRLENLEIKLSRQPDGSLAVTDGNTPVLRSLTLSRCPLPWCSLNLSKLNSLSLHYSPLLSMEDFLPMLSCMQDLTLLDLQHVLPSAHSFLSSGGLSNSPQIELPRLTLLAVIAPLSTVITLLSCINVPMKTRLSLGPLPERGSSIGDYALISSCLAQRFNISEKLLSSCPIFRSLVIDTGCVPNLTFSSLERDGCLDNPLDHNIPLKITFGDGDEEWQEMTDSDKYRVMSDICCSLPLTNVRTLHVAKPNFPSTIWKEILGHLNGLRYMRLGYGYMPDLSMLSLTADEPKENLGGQPIHDQDPTLCHILVPALEELELFRITFIPDDATPWGAHMSQKSLFDVLATRKGLRDGLTMIHCQSEVISDG